jgi:nitrate/nitrite-specific signal transduction histidine kinase
MSFQTSKTTYSAEADAPGNQCLPPASQPELICDREAVQKLDATLRALQADRHQLEHEVAELKSEQQLFLERYVGLEEQNSTLTTLYVACQRLHATLDRAEVLLTLREIIANLAGCEEYVLFTVDSNGWLRRVDSLGFEEDEYEEIQPGTGLIGRSAQTGEAYLRGESDSAGATGPEGRLTACIPLKRDGAVTGAIALFRLLPQKLELQELDRELFRLLETHLAMALYGTELQQRAGAKNGDAA